MIINTSIIRYLLFFVIISTALFAEDPGKKAFDEGNYQGAWTYYQDKLDQNDRGGSILNYNAAAAAQKLENSEAAEQYYIRSLNGKVPKLQSKAHYNLGQLYLKQQDSEKALEHFMQSMILDSEDMNAKAAYEQAKQLMEQQKQQQQKNQDNQENKEEKNDQQQEQKSQKNEDEQDKKDEKESQQQEQKQEKDQDQQMQDQEAKMTEAKEEMPQDQVENILNAMRERELESMKKLLKEKYKSAKIKRSKDW